MNFYPSVHWFCPKCDAKNYSDMIPHEFSQEEREEMLERGLDPCSTQWSVPPETIECLTCNFKMFVGR